MRSLVLLSVLAALAGCYAGPGAEDPAFGKGTKLPLGVLPPSTDGSGVGAYTGIFPSVQADDPFCCWLASSASFEVRVPPNGRELILTTFVPGTLEVFKRQRQTVTVSVDRGATRKFTLRNGVSILHVPLASEPRERIVGVILTAGLTFMPRNERINDDTRELSFYLKSVRTSTR